MMSNTPEVLLGYQAAKSLESPTSLTEFAPLHAEEKSPSSHFFSRFFTRNKALKSPPERCFSVPEREVEYSVQQSEEEEQLSRDVAGGSQASLSSSSSSSPFKRKESVDPLYVRSVANVMRRISGLLDRKNMLSSSYKESDFKQYWMPDSNCKECYDCGDKFTTFRRRHHCRICGQIFCNRCCNQVIPGKSLGYSGDLRVCKYCCKVAETYLPSLDNPLESSDVWTLQEDVAQRLLTAADRLSSPAHSDTNRVRRKSSTLGFREEDLTRAKFMNHPDLSDFPSELIGHDRRIMQPDESGLRELWKQVVHPVSGADFQSHRHRLRTYNNCVVGSTLVEWLITQGQATNRIQASALCQAFLDSKLLVNIYHDQVFVDGYSLYQAGDSTPSSTLEVSVPIPEVSPDRSNSQESQEPLWVKEIQTSEAEPSGCETDESVEQEECPAPGCGHESRLSSSSSIFYLDMNVKESKVTLSRPHGSPKEAPKSKKPGSQAKKNYENVFKFPVNENILTGSMLENTNQDHNRNAILHIGEILQENTEGSKTFDSLNAAYRNLEQNLMHQLLSTEGLSLLWYETINPIIHRVAETVWPDVRTENEEKDIRKYIQIKKIPGGSKSECRIVHGVVCTKNVANKKMNQTLTDPRILLLDSAISYQRIENKLTSIDPVLMQEFEYLKNAVAKITVHKPSLILVEKTVSSIALDMLLDLGISVVRNVKPSVMKRVAHCTQAGIVSSIEAHLKKPKLGLCHQFAVQTYQLPGNQTKTLMFFDGCPSNLGCTILLRGGSSAELKKVKKITYFMTYVAYSWNLERSFLMECFARPPARLENLPLILQPSDDSFPQDVNAKHCTLKKNDLDTKSSLKPLTAFQNRTSGDVSPNLRTVEEESEKKLEITFVDDCSDPLRSYLKTEDENVFFPPEGELVVEPLPFSNHFRKALDDVVLCCTPYITFSLPYLETEAGRSCQLREYFPEDMYWSGQLTKGGAVTRKSNVDLDEVSLNSQAADYLDMRPPHQLVNSKLTSNLLNNNYLQSLLSDFRARGGRFRSNCLEWRLNRMNFVKTVDINANIEPPSEKAEFDYLSPYNHQKLSVSFCTYSETSLNAPRYCNGPVLFNMGFYGENDITLGGFLEHYCFNSSYACSGGTCESPTEEHIRKFAHGSGCVVIQICKRESFISSSESDIIMWTVCPKCNESSPFVVMSQKTWAMSFAKYLEFRFHGGQYCRMGSQKNCTHSLHQDHYHFFAHKQIVASLQYVPVLMREVCLPSSTIIISDEPIPLPTVVEEIKVLAVKGYGVYSTILEHLCTLKVECQNTKHEPAITEMMEQQKLERSKFRERIEGIQLNLTSPTLETKQQIEANIANSEKDTCLKMFQIADSVAHLKIQIAEAVHNWNAKIQDFVTVKKKEEKSIQRGGHTVTRMSSSSGLLPADYSGSAGYEASVTTKSSGSEVAESPPAHGSQPVSHISSDIQTEHSWKLVCSSGNGSKGDNHTFQSITEESCESEECKQTMDVLEKLDTEVAHVVSNTPALDSSLLLVASLEKHPSDSSSMQSSWQEISSADLKDSELGDSDVFEKNPVSPSVSLEKRQQECKQTVDVLEKLDTEVAHVVSNTPEPCMPVSRSSSSLSSYASGASPGLFSNLLSDNSGHPEAEGLHHSSPSHQSHIPLDGEKKNEVRGHERSKSDGAEKLMENRLSRSRLDEENLRTERKERGSMKTLISQLLNTSAITPVQSPFTASEHYLLPQGDKVPVIVYDQEPGSIIAYTLSSPDYEQQLQELKVNLSSAAINSFKECQSSSPTLKKRFQLPKQPERTSSVETLNNLPQTESSPIDFTDFALCSSQELEKSSSKTHSKSPNLHIELQFSDATTRFYCRVYFAEQFRKLRRILFPDGEERYIRSLSRCVPWIARGGKSGSTFCKTHDDRFILKQMSRFEVSSFLDFGPYYFQYITRACAEKKPTALAKIVGVYRIGYKNSATSKESKLDLLVMENLFYGRTIQQRFDLKGSVRNRLVTMSSQDEEEDIVLLDENLLKMMCDSPLYIRPHSRHVLTSAINEDSQFLASHTVMDYSLLVGLDDQKKELVVGIIDYIRTFTWDKKLEMVVKIRRGILGGHRELPTVVSPEQYRKRFCLAMDGYFFWVPDRWSELGDGFKT